MSVPARKPDVATLRPSAELWGPLLIASVALLLGFPAGLLLAVINWYRMGMLAKSRSRLIAGVVAVNIGAFFYLRREVDTDTDAYAYAGNEVHPANRLTGIAIGIGGFLFFVLVYIVMVIFFVA